MGTYLNFTQFALLSWLFQWVPGFARSIQPWLEPRYPALWLWLLTRSYALTYGMGKPQTDWVQKQGRSHFAKQASESEPIVDASSQR
jgi:lycopene cyclase CruA